MLCPWADILYAMDRKWWTVMRSEAKSFQGQKYSSVGNIPGVKMTPAEPKGGNSGAGAILLAKHHGARRIILLGYDCKPDSSGKRHWHGKHRGKLTDAGSLDKFPAQFQRLAPRLTGVEVLNATRDTELNCFPKVTLEIALNG